MKILALPKRGGLTYAKICWWICRCIPKTLLRHHSTQIMIIHPPKSEHLSPKIDHHQQLVNIYPKSNHSLPKMVIYALFYVKMSRVAFARFCRQIHQSARIGVRGGGSSQSWQCQDFQCSYYRNPSLIVTSSSLNPTIWYIVIVTVIMCVFRFVLWASFLSMPSVEDRHICACWIRARRMQNNCTARQ